MIHAVQSDKRIPILTKILTTTTTKTTIANYSIIQNLIVKDFSPQ